MDKATRALELAEQNSAEIVALKKRRPTVKYGSVNAGKTTFGDVSGGFAMVFFDGDTCMLYSCGNPITAGPSPLIAQIGAGKLELDAVRSKSRVIIFS